jgi:hypothetical protein
MRISIDLNQMRHGDMRQSMDEEDMKVRDAIAQVLIGG